MDLVFATYVKSKINGLNDEMIDRSSLFKIIGSSVLPANNFNGDLFSVNDQQVFIVDFQPEVYLLKIYFKYGIIILRFI